MNIGNVFYKFSFFILLLFSFLISACTHRKVEVSQLRDSELKCENLAEQIVDVRDLKDEIDSRTGFSGRNVGMALLFWPGIIVNEINGSKADSLASERLRNLHKNFEAKKCDFTLIKKAEQEVAENKKREQKNVTEGNNKPYPASNP